MDQTRVAALLEFALATAAREDLGERELGEIHLLKMVYLADLAYAKTHQGQTLTKVPWVFHTIVMRGRAFPDEIMQSHHWNAYARTQISTSVA